MDSPLILEGRTILAKCTIYINHLTVSEQVLYHLLRFFYAIFKL